MLWWQTLKECVANHGFLFFYINIVWYRVDIWHIPCLLHLPSQNLKHAIDTLCLRIWYVSPKECMYFVIYLNPTRIWKFLNSLVFHHLSHICYNIPPYCHCINIWHQHIGSYIFWFQLKKMFCCTFIFKFRWILHAPIKAPRTTKLG